MAGIALHAVDGRMRHITYFSQDRTNYTYRSRDADAITGLHIFTQSEVHMNAFTCSRAPASTTGARWTGSQPEMQISLREILLRSACA